MVSSDVAVTELAHVHSTDKEVTQLILFQSLFKVTLSNLIQQRNSQNRIHKHISKHRKFTDYSPKGRLRVVRYKWKKNSSKMYTMSLNDFKPCLLWTGYKSEKPWFHILPQISFLCRPQNWKSTHILLKSWMQNREKQEVITLKPSRIIRSIHLEQQKKFKVLNAKFSEIARNVYEKNNCWWLYLKGKYVRETIRVHILVKKFFNFS